MNLILHEAPRLLANILILQPIDERYIWMPTTAILGEPKLSASGMSLQVTASLCFSLTSTGFGHSLTVWIMTCF
ncbi:MAG: hypothetical protein NT070_21185 [Cyanobacteria bacterium]|nr:hypothetical protein [Cyanobacteriota bacterium]